MIHDSPARRAMVWALLGGLIALVCYFAWRGYLSSDMLLNFANMFYC